MAAPPNTRRKPTAVADRAQHPADTTERSHGRWLWVGILLLAAGLRLWGLGDKALWLDEVMSLRLATQPTLADTLREVESYDAHPPLYAVLHFFWMRPAPLRWRADGVDWNRPAVRVDGYARVPSAVFGIGAVVMMVLLARRLYGRAAGFLAGGLMAVSAFHVYFSQEARPYALVVFLTLALTWIFVRILAAGERVSVGLCFLYAALGAACLYTYVLTIVLLISQGLLFLVLGKRSARTMALGGAATAAIAAAFLPWLPMLRTRRAVLRTILAGGAAPPLETSEIVRAFGEWLFGPLRFSSWNWPYHGLLALILLGLAVLVSRSQKHSRLLLPGMIVIPIVLLLVLPIPRVHVFEAKHLIFVMPMCLLLLVGAARGREHRLAAAAIVLLLILVNAGELVVYLDRAYQKERWFEAMQFVRDEERAGDVIVVNPPYAAFALRYHYRGELTMTGVPETGVDAGMRALARRVADGEYGRVILVNCAGNVSRPVAAVNRRFAADWRLDDMVQLKGAAGNLTVSIHSLRY